MYDINQDGFITYDEMLAIVRSIYKMTGQMVKLPEDEDTPEKVSHANSPIAEIERGSRLMLDNLVWMSRSELTSCSGGWT